MPVKVIRNDSHFRSELAATASKLVVIDFTAAWCMPCQNIASFFEQMATKYPKAIFLKVDVDKCQDSAASHNVSAMPTFIFYKNRARIDRLQGSNPGLLEMKIKQFYGEEEGEEDEDTGVQGHMDLMPFLLKSQCEVLNESDEHPFAQCITTGDGFLESDCDEQLILSFPFTQAVKIHSIKIKAPGDKGPKTIRLFINQPNTLDFDTACSNQAVQEIELTEKDLQGNPVNLRYVKFQNVQNLQIFIKDNQTDQETTQINYIQLIGSPITTTNMSDFKRVTGKKGEAH